MEYRDYYKIMGVARDATQDDIKRAYRKLARKYHPDVSKETDAEVRFKELGEAYEVLKDPEKRLAYDQLGANWKQGQDFRAPPDWDAGFEFRGGAGGGDARFSDFFESLFGRAAQGGFRAGPQGRRDGFSARGQDHHAKLLVDVMDSINGSTRAIHLQLPELDAAGHVRARQRTLNVKIPKGIRAGQQIRLSGQGDPGRGNAPPGDLYLEVEFKPDPVYRVDGGNLYMDLPIAPWEAALGASVQVPTPAGRVDLKIPAGAEGGSKLRLRGRGLPGKQAGDLYAVLRIVLPKADTPAARAAWEQLRDAVSFEPRRS